MAMFLQPTGLKRRVWIAVLGLLLLSIVFWFAAFVSTDIRLVYMIGAILCFCAATWIGAKSKADWLSMFLLSGPLVLGFSYLLLPKFPALWPSLLLWIVAVLLGARFFAAKSQRTKWRISGVCLLVVGSLWFCIWYAPEALARSLNRFGNSPTPTFTLQRISRQAVPPLTLKPGKILVIDFFSTSCAPCIAELPELERARAELEGKNDIEFVLVGSDVDGDTPERFTTFVRGHHVSLPLAFDSGGKAHAGFGFTGVPALVVIDRSGRARLTREGYNAAERNFKRELVQFLKSL